jgi:hypothetical protein
MAMIEKRGPAQYRVRVRRADLPKPISRTFESREEAEKWARRIESEVDAGKRVLFLSNAEAKSMTLREGLERYRDEKTLHKAGAAQERNRIARWLEHPSPGRCFTRSSPATSRSIATSGWRKARPCDVPPRAERHQPVYEAALLVACAISTTR